MVAVASEGGIRHNDTKKYTMDGLLQFLCCLYGGCQFTKGTDVWATAKKGMMPAPDFGKLMSADRFRRWMRYLSEGPENASESNPWREIPPRAVAIGKVPPNKEME